jgi:hypothetical protein
MLSIDPSKLKFRIYDPLVHDLLNLDFTQTDGSDSLLVEEYVKNHILKDIENSSVKAYAVTYEENAIAFFTLSMSVICSKSLLKDNDDDENVGNDGKLEKFVFPALLMGKIGIDKKYRCFGIGKYICLFCMGLAQKTNEKMACTFFIFRTTKSLAEKIYGPKYCFRWKKNSPDKMVWAYRKIL